MIRIVTIGFFLLFATADVLHANDWADKLVGQARFKYQQLERYNDTNERLGKAHLNEYVIELDPEWTLDPNWIEERGNGNKILPSKNYEVLSRMLRDFNEVRKDDLRFYVIVINDYQVQIHETIDLSRVRGVVDDLHDLVSFPDAENDYERFKNEIGNIPERISDALHGEGHENRLVYFYGQIRLFKLDQKAKFFKHDNLSINGPEISQVDQQLREAAKKSVSKDDYAEEQIEGLVAGIINAVHVIIDEPDENVPLVDCGDSFEQLLSKTSAHKENSYASSVSSVAALLDAPAAKNRAGSEYFIVDQPENIDPEDLFTSSILPDKLSLLAEGNSDYKLYVVYKEVDFILETSEWKDFAKAVYEKSSTAKNDPNTIIVVVPYYETICVGKSWLFPVSKHTGLLMPGVYCEDEGLRTLMNSAVAGEGKTWERNFNQAYSHIPKKHYLLKYAISYDFITKRYGTVITEGPGHDQIFELQILIDSRLQTNIDAKLSLDEQMRLKAPLPSVMEQSTNMLRSLPEQLGHPYLMKHGLKERAIAKLQGNGLNSFSPVAEQFVKWFVTGKAAEYSGAMWSSMGYSFNPATNSPSGDNFVTGINPVVLEKYLASIDAVGLVLNFAELDWITDGAGFLIASYYKDTHNKVVYGASLAIPVSAIVIKTLAKRRKALTRALNGEWQLVEEATYLARSADELASGLVGSLRNTYDQLVAAGLKSTVGDDNSIRLLTNNGEEIALIANNKFVTSKWALYDSRVHGKIETDAGYWLVKDGNSVVGIDLGFKDGRVLDASEVNAYWKHGRSGYEPYLRESKVTEKTLSKGHRLFVVEYITQGQPGLFASKERITSIQELREKLAVLKNWKDEDGGFLIVREYEVKESLKVRDGVIGSQVEESGINKGKTLLGGGHQYEFVEGNWDPLDNPYERYLQFVTNHEIKI